ncbi:hypothetical protein [Methylobacterium trifolii]|uniref:Chemotaxis protein CheA n=1 Tax=Methylobacterium trifolii TaxID=1003092 RepID=A0ABQ4TVT6_9HYPH|nr:hypothetical protein [Methylobacterium trifolii]GJE58087.1 hypothetical protein MPOCJGCO_0165 [Methylobacterium trifolii]
MNDLTLDPSETRPVRAAAARPPGRAGGRVVLFSVLGVAGLGAFGLGATNLLAGLAGPPKPRIAVRQNASDWPDLKDGMPALATGSVAPPRGSVPPVAAVAPEPAVEPPARTAALVPPEPAIRPAAVDTVLPKPVVEKPVFEKPVAEKPARRLPVIENAAVIGPARQASLVAPSKTVATVSPRPAETVRAREAGATFAALPPEPAKAKPRPEKAASVRKPAATVASAEAAPAAAAESEETEVFGLKVPSLAPAGRKLRESVEALGDAVKSLPDRF